MLQAYKVDKIADQLVEKAIDYVNAYLWPILYEKYKDQYLDEARDYCACLYKDFLFRVYSQFTRDYSPSDGKFIKQVKDQVNLQYSHHVLLEQYVPYKETHTPDAFAQGIHEACQRFLNALPDKIDVPLQQTNLCSTARSKQEGFFSEEYINNVVKQDILPHNQQSSSILSSKIALFTADKSFTKGKINFNKALGISLILVGAIGCGMTFYNTALLTQALLIASYAVFGGIAAAGIGAVSVPKSRICLRCI